MFRKMILSHHGKSKKHLHPFFGGKWLCPQHWAMESSSFHLSLYLTSYSMSHLWVPVDLKIKMSQIECIIHSTSQAKGWPMPHCNMTFVPNISWWKLLSQGRHHQKALMKRVNEWRNEWRNDERLCSLFFPIKAIHNPLHIYPSWEHV